MNPNNLSVTVLLPQVVTTKHPLELVNFHDLSVGSAVSFNLSGAEVGGGSGAGGSSGTGSGAGSSTGSGTGSGATEGVALVASLTPQAFNVSGPELDAPAVTATPVAHITIINGSGEALHDASGDAVSPASGQAASNEPVDGLPASGFGIEIAFAASELLDEVTGGNGSCSEPGFLQYDAATTCVAGCCVDGRCSCHPGFGGPMCESKLRCAYAESAFSGFELETCTTRLPEFAGDGIVCSCDQLGYVAILRFRYFPSTDVHRWLERAGSRWAIEVLELIAAKPVGWVLFFTGVLTATATARTLDMATVYALPPSWAQPRRTSRPLRDYFVYTVRVSASRLQLPRGHTRTREGLADVSSRRSSRSA